MILGLSGSLRKRSFNSALLRAAHALFPQDITIGDISGIPLYNGDLEEQGVPGAVTELKAQLVSAEGLLLVTPEYNNSMPGVLKNTLDWLSRPTPEPRGVFRDKPVAVIGATPGGLGTVLAQNAYLPVLRTLGARHFTAGRLMVSSAHRVFDESQALADADVEERLQRFIGEFLAFSAAARG